MYIEIGPASLVISGQKDGKPCEFSREDLEGITGDILRDIRECLPLLKQKAYKIKKVSRLPDVARRMVEAAKMVDEKTLTPMAAVAGAVSDMVKERLKMDDPDLISVNNGGDLSIFNRNGILLRIGIGDITASRRTPYIIAVEGRVDTGIATSGFGGRSFTLGIADIVTAIGKEGAIADAAATYICNCTNVETDQVVRGKASGIDPNTDIPDEYVTLSIGDLSGELVARALDNGLTAAKNLKKNKMIDDAAIMLKGCIATTIINSNNKYITLEVQDGNQKDRHYR